MLASEFLLTLISTQYLGRVAVTTDVNMLAYSGRPAWDFSV